MHSVQPLARLLVTSGLVMQQALDEVLALQKTDGRRLGEVLAERGLVGPQKLAQFLSHQLACPWVSLDRLEISRDAVDVLPRKLALKHFMVPVHLRTTKGATTLYVAMDNPTDDVALTEAAAATMMPVKAMVAMSNEIRTHLERLYGTSVVKATLAPPPALGGIPAISLKHEAEPRRSPSLPPKPPPPRPSVAPPRVEPTVLDAAEVVEDAPSSHPESAARVLVVQATETFVRRVRASAARFAASAASVTLAEAAKAAAARPPCAVVVTEDVYARERAALNRLALEAGARLIVSSNAFEGRQVEGLLEDAIRRWQRSSYERGGILDGRYELLRDVGGRVAGSRWEVRHLRTGRRSLLKIGVRVARDEADAEAVLRAQAALASFIHPGATDFRDAGDTALGDPYIVLEMLEGRTLEGLVAARGALRPADAYVVIRRIAAVLAAAHDAGIRHGAVRPENVLIVRDPWGVERTKLVHWEEATVAEGADASIDLAGLGACAFLVLAGRMRDEGEDVQSIRSGKWAPVETPTALASVVSRTLGGAGADRFTYRKRLHRCAREGIAAKGRHPSSARREARAPGGPG